MAFKKGQSGNPNGRPKGSKNKKTEFYESIIAYFDETKLTNLLNKLYEKGMAGDTSALIALLKYLIPDANKRLDMDVRMSLSGKVEEEQTDWSFLTDEEVEKIHDIVIEAKNRSEHTPKQLKAI